MVLSREPAREHEPGYPTFSEFDPGRRAALRAIGLAGLSAVGLQLVGCPGSPGAGAPPAGAGTGTPPPDTGTPPTDTDWVPWRDTEAVPVPRNIPMAGACPPPQMELPVAIVVGGGPIEVEFADGRRTKLAVALVVQQGTTPAAIKADAPEHVAAVKAAAKALPGSVTDSADGLATLAARIQEEVLKATPGLVLEGVQAAPAYEPPTEPPPEQSRRAAPSADAPAAAAAPAPAPAPRAPAAAAAPAPVTASPARAPLPAGRVWVPCGKPGCTSCGAK